MSRFITGNISLVEPVLLKPVAFVTVDLVHRPAAVIPRICVDIMAAQAVPGAS